MRQGLFTPLKFRVSFPHVKSLHGKTHLALAGLCLHIVRLNFLGSTVVVQGRLVVAQGLVRIPLRLLVPLFLFALPPSRQQLGQLLAHALLRLCNRLFQRTGLTLRIFDFHRLRVRRLLASIPRSSKAARYWSSAC